MAKQPLPALSQRLKNDRAFPYASGLHQRTLAIELDSQRLCLKIEAQPYALHLDGFGHRGRPDTMIADRLPEVEALLASSQTLADAVLAQGWLAYQN